MNPKMDMNASPPPKLVASLASGFNNVASHIWLISLPVIIDLFLWLGPHFRLQTLLKPLVESLYQTPNTASTEMGEIMRLTQTLWMEFITRANLATTLRTLPLGVPSLMSGKLPIETPFGMAFIHETQSGFEVFLLWLIFVLSGLILGCIYFLGISKVVYGETTQQTLQMFGRTTLHIILMTLILIVVAILLCIPGLVIFPLLVMINPGAGQLSLILGMMILIWMMLPLVFTPHAIITLKQSAWIAMLTSARLVKRASYGTGFFFLLAILIGEGMDVLWNMPPETSWMSLIGILGHAFVSTSLVAASFVYYRDILQWSQSLRETTVKI